MKGSKFQPMKKVLVLLFALGLSSSLFSQTVQDIQVYTQGDEVRVTYRIDGSTEAQFFNVTLTCSMDGGARFSPVSVKGDVGAGIQGGKAMYSILWDVFKDVNRVGNAEFFVKIDMVRDLDDVTSPVPVTEESMVNEMDRSMMETVQPEKPEPKPLFQRRGFIAYNGSLSSPYGISVGMIKNWGFYGTFRFGGLVDDWQTNVWFTATGGGTKFIAGNERYRLHGYAGLGVTFESYEEYVFDTSWTDSYFTAEAGLIGVIRFINLTLGVEYLTYYGADLVFGIGFVF
jgi:hypothetical protein